VSKQPERVTSHETPCGEVSAREAGYLLTLQELTRDAAQPTQAALARAMEVSPPTAFEMVRRLRQLGLLETDRLALTNQGRSAALVLASRRRAAHVLTHDLLGITDDRQADIEAARLAPNVSPRLTRHLIAGEQSRKQD
jgi:Mn-dependent DtxR family transcriptional regulator